MLAAPHHLVVGSSLRTATSLPRTRSAMPQVFLVATPPVGLCGLLRKIARGDLSLDRELPHIVQARPEVVRRLQLSKITAICTFLPKQARQWGCGEPAAHRGGGDGRRLRPGRGRHRGPRLASGHRAGGRGGPRRQRRRRRDVGPRHGRRLRRPAHRRAQPQRGDRVHAGAHLDAPSWRGPWSRCPPDDRRPGDPRSAAAGAGCVPEG